jgi:hypothetical protein
MTHQPSDNDLAFRAQFESCEFRASDFDHRAPLRLAYIYLTNAGDSIAAVDPTGISARRLCRRHEAC